MVVILALLFSLDSGETGVHGEEGIVEQNFSAAGGWKGERVRRSQPRIPVSHLLIIKRVFTELCLLKVPSLPNMSKAHEQTFSMPLRKFEIQVMIINVLQPWVCGREISAKGQLGFFGICLRLLVRTSMAA